MKSVPLIKRHEQLGAKIVDFAGFNMPIQYSGIGEEHLTVRKSVGIFDISHMGEFWISGPGSYELLQKVTTNDLALLKPGKAQYTCLPNGKGGLVDDLLIYQYAEQKYMLVVNATNIKKDWDWLSQQNKEQVTMENDSDQMALLAVQGPKALATLEKLTREDLAGMKIFRFKVGQLAGVDDVIISATGYTGEHGFELYTKNEQVEKLWDAIMEAGSEFGIKPIGLGARDSLRLEAGLCLYGNDIDENTSPIEAGLGWVEKFKAHNNFINKDYFWKQKQEGISKKLVGFVLKDKGIPRQHYDILNREEKPVGAVTSGNMSPLLNKGFGMGYVNVNYTEPGNELFIKVRNKMLRAEVVRMPLHKNQP